MLVFARLAEDGRRFAEVDARAVVGAQRGGVEHLAHFDGGGDGGVGDDDAAEGAERGEGVEGCGRAEEGMDVLEVLGDESCKGVEVLGRGSVLTGFVWGGQGAKRTVMRRVFDGGEGGISGGREERSRESGVEMLCEFAVEVGLVDGEIGGDGS